jgi:biopolymer transport protein ExbD
MAEIIQEEKQKGGKKKPKKLSAHIDMTPMVDLMCLLITFFMLTAAFSKPKIMDIILPEKLQKDEVVNAPKIAKSRTLNIVLGSDNKVYWYPGTVEDPNNPPPLQETDFSATGIRHVLLDRNISLARKINQFNDDVLTGKIEISRDSVNSAINQLKNDDDTGPIVLIKGYKLALYKNFVDILDEMSICGIASYMIVEIAPIEEMMVESAMGVTPPIASAQN